MYNAIDIAMYAVDKCTSEGVSISNLQLQKILYYIQVNFLRVQDKVAFNDTIEAWQHGPVVPNVYSYFNCYGGTKIYRFFPDKRMIFKAEDDKDIVDKVIQMCRKLDPWELVQRSHKVGGPWHKVYNGFNVTIPISIIRKYSRGV